MLREITLLLLSTLTVGLTTPAWPESAGKLASPNQAIAQPAGRNTSRKPHASHSVTYTNRRYGFRFNLPKSWKGYSVVQAQWAGEIDSRDSLDEHGPLILIRHPQYTQADPREDIPIMVFTRKQWREVDNSKLIVSAAPFGPGEIGRNRRFVFATPPRFFFDYLNGWEEVVRILSRPALRAIPPTKASVCYSR